MDEDNSTFQILIGGQSPEEKELERTKTIGINDDEELPHVIKARAENNTIMDHWNSCFWRSDKQLVRVQGCCGSANSEVLMYVCNLMQIQSLTPLVCERCTKFQKKEENI